MSFRPPHTAKDLADFPSVSLYEDRTLYRIHLADNEAAFFGDRGIYRFDCPLGRRKRFGTCYLSTSHYGAFLETLGGIRPLPQHMVDERVISELIPKRPLRLADVTDQRVIGRWGLFGDLSAGDSYEVTQEWAVALWEAEFDGVLYYAKHDPGFVEQSVAVFGPPGVQKDLLNYEKGDDDGQPEPISQAFLDEIEERFEIAVFPTAPLL